MTEYYLAASSAKFSGPRNWLISGLLVIGLGSVALAQQTVFNVPTTDILDKGKVYVEVDVSAKVHDERALKKFSSVVPRVVVGVRQRRVEVGLNVTGNIQPGRDSTTLVPNVKVKLYGNEGNGWAMVTGANVYLPVRQRVYNAGVYNYVQVSKMLGSKTRIGFGGYFFSRNVVSPNANRAGGQFTLEQSLTHWLSFNADWFTGRHSMGYLTFGPAFKLGKRTVGTAAYAIGNEHVRDGNHFLYFSLGYLVN
ncbi:MAG: hypothetical protein ABIP75_05105 [Pyrinomonadaceae bacterium]